MKMPAHNWPAFPSPGVVLPNGRQQGAYEGMTLRDWFAGKALQGLLAQSQGTAIASPIEAAAVYAYAMADAMLAARDGSAA